MRQYRNTREMLNVLRGRIKTFTPKIADYESMTKAELEKIAKGLGIEVKRQTKAELKAMIKEKTCISD